MEKSVGCLLAYIFGRTDDCLSSSIKEEVLSTIVVFTIEVLVYWKLLSLMFIELSSLLVNAKRF